MFLLASSLVSGDARPFRVALLSVSLLLTACATSTPQMTPALPAPSAPAFEEVLVQPRPVLPVPPGPREDALYRALVAEMAGQRGHLDLAVSNYMDLARQYPRDARLAERATRVALFAKREEFAFEAAGLWVVADPKSLDARQVLALLQMRRGNQEDAYRNLDLVLSTAGSGASERLRSIATILGRENDRRAALALMRRLVERRRDNPEALFAQALLAVRADEMAEARTAMEAALKLVPPTPSMALAYLGILQKQGDGDAAATWLGTVLAQRPEDFDLRLVYARLLADMKRYADARLQFERLAASAPDNSDVQYALGLLNLQDNAPARARPYFERMLELGERPAEASFYLGQIEEAAGSRDRALDYYRAVDDGQFLLDAQVRVAFLLAQQDKLADARAHLAELATAKPELKPKLARAEGEILVDKGQLAEAMAVYDRALEAGFDAELLYTRAMLAERMNRLDILERDLRAVIERDPHNAQALNALGYTLADRTTRYQEALDLIDRALALTPDDFYILDSKGWVLFRLGRHDEALVFLRRALAERNDPEVAAHLVEVLWTRGDHDAARQAYVDAKRAFPDDSKLMAVGKRLGL